MPVKSAGNNHQSCNASEQFIDRDREQRKRDYVESCIQEAHQNSYFTLSLEQLHEVTREAEERFDIEIHHIKEAKLPDDALIATDTSRGEQTSLAPHPDLQSTDQPISDIAPPPPPPGHDPDKKGKRKQDKKIPRKKRIRPENSTHKFRIKHTFDKHGSHKTHQLQMEAKNKGHSLGQWIDNSAAEDFIAKNLNKTKNGTITVELPEGLGRIVHPDGTFTPATHATLVPSKSGVKTAYPVNL